MGPGARIQVSRDAHELTRFLGSPASSRLRLSAIQVTITL